MGFDAQVLSAGVLLGAVVFYESFSLYRQGLRKGERSSLLREAEEMKRSLAAGGAKPAKTREDIL
jgi:hypothetical protein